MFAYRVASNFPSLDNVQWTFKEIQQQRLETGASFIQQKLIWLIELFF